MVINVKGASPAAEPDDPLQARTIGELVRVCARRNGAHVAVIETSPGDGEARQYTSKQIDEFATRAALVYSEKYGLEPRRSSDRKPRVVAVCGNGDFEYLITVLALAKLGHTTFFLSPRLSDESYIGLLKASNASSLLVQHSHRDLGERLSRVSLPLQTADIVTRDEYDALPDDHVDVESNLTQALDLERERPAPVWILHSSGSTGIPKLVYVSNAAAIPRYALNLDTFGLDTLTTVPLYHAFGMSSFFRSFMSRSTIQLYSKLPLAARDLIQVTETRRFGLFSAVPFTIKLLAESEKGVNFLKSFSIVTTGGSPMPEELGDQLVRQGVQLTSVYGSSETGTLLTSARPRGDDEWNWLRLPVDNGHLLRFEPQGADTYELICPSDWPLLADSNQEDGSWRTKDLFSKHPTMAGAFKYIGRLDDVMVLENGEKVNPIAVENEISSSPLVGGCIIFGTGKPSAGVAVIPSSSTTLMTAEELRSAIWLVVNDSQTSLPAYARLVPEMLLLLPIGSQVPRTDKGTVIRSKFLDLYKDQMDDIYARQEVSSETVKLSEKELGRFLSAQLAKVLDVPAETQFDTEQDFSALGLDSLQAIQLRSAILRHVDLNGQSLGLNVVFDYPTLESLEKEIVRVSSGGEAADTSLVNEQDAEAMFERYIKFNKTIQSPGQNIVLTGATGSLGVHLLTRLALSPQVRTVYCLVRASSNAASNKRVEQSLDARRLRDRFHGPLPDKIVCLASDFSDTWLGLGQGLFREVANKVDAVYHCGWTVNFNQRLRTFEKDCIAGVHHLINLCVGSERSSPARFMFFSSIGTIMDTKDEIIPERLPESLSEAMPTGYSRSKYVAEQICARAAAEVGLPVAILRIGQIVGDTTHGIWNTTEAAPLMMRSAQTIGALPTLEERVRWLPVDHVAQIAIEIGSSSAVLTSKAPVFNVVNPNTLRWTEELLPLLANTGLTFEAVSPSEWVSRLEKSDPDAKANPTRKLLDYYREQCKGSEEDKDWETSRAAKWSPTFSSVTAPSPELISVIVDYFKSAWKM